MEFVQNIKTSSLRILISSRWNGNPYVGLGSPYPEEHGPDSEVVDFNVYLDDVDYTMYSE